MTRNITINNFDMVTINNYRNSVKHALSELVLIHIDLAEKLNMYYEPITKYDPDFLSNIHKTFVEQEKKLKYTDESIILNIYAVSKNNR